MTKWTFHNWTDGIPAVRPTSIVHAIELLVEHAALHEYGIYVDYVHDERGLISCSANAKFSSLSFCPDFDPKTHSLAGSRSARRIKPAIKEPFRWVDGTGLASYMPVHFVLPMAKVVRAMTYILEFHDFPAFIRWSNPATEC
jgi:hypothetical protein